MTNQAFRHEISRQNYPQLCNTEEETNYARLSFDDKFLKVLRTLTHFSGNCSDALNERRKKREQRVEGAPRPFQGPGKSKGFLMSRRDEKETLAGYISISVSGDGGKRARRRTESG